MKRFRKIKAFFSTLVAFLLISAIYQACGEDPDNLFVESRSDYSSSPKESESMTQQEIDQCLTNGGVITKTEGHMQCSFTVGSDNIQEAQVDTGCAVEETEVGVIVSCEGSDKVIVRHGQDGIGCSAIEVAEGYEISCSDSKPFIVRHGKDGKDGEMCQVTKTEEGGLISCGDDEPVLVTHGEDGEDGVNCQVTETEEGAIVSCGEGSDVVAIKHGDDASLPDSSIVSSIDPCGPHDGFDEVLLKMNDGRYIAYFEHGSKRRFLTILDPDTQAGNYKTTDNQACTFTITSEGDLFW